MPHAVLKYPSSVYPGEANAECPEALPILDVLIRAIEKYGPSPPGYTFKNLGKTKASLWQINFKAGKGRQVRVLYAPYANEIVLFRIHKKGSPQEQQRAYELAMKRKSEYEARVKALQSGTQGHVRNRTVH